MAGGTDLTIGDNGSSEKPTCAFTGPFSSSPFSLTGLFLLLAWDWLGDPVLIFTVTLLGSFEALLFFKALFGCGPGS